MAKWFLLPPVTFIVVLVINTLLSKLSKGLAYKDDSVPGGKYKSYACGENVDSPRVQPGYEQFFPFAFFFTIMHVVALVIATAPVHSLRAALIAALFIMAAISGLFILFRK